MSTETKLWTEKECLWRCRRGLLELDVLLENFYHKYYAMLTLKQKQALQQLLERSDMALQSLLVFKQTSGELTTVEKELVEWIIEKNP